MRRSKEFDDILNECLERILNQGETIEQCLAHYPEQADELEPLLETVSLAKEAAEVEPRPEFRVKARHEFHMALQEMEPAKGRWFSGWRPQWATVLVTVLVLLLASGSTVAAAGNSMPDEPLYPVKLATETVRLALTPSVLGKAELYVKLADKRVAEIAKMADKGKAEQVEQTAQLLDEQLVAMANLAKSQEGGEAVFQAAPPPMEKAPEAAVSEAPQAAEKTPEVTLEKPPEITAQEAPEVERTPPAEKGKSQVSARKGQQPAAAEAPAEPELAAVEKDIGEGEKVLERDTGFERKARLKELLERRALDNREALRKALEEAPEAAKPALRKALEIAEERYEEAMRSLE